MGSNKQKLKEIFELMDSDGGGAISEDEVTVFCKSLPRDMSNAEIHELFRQKDSDGSGDIDADEFCGLVDLLQGLVGIAVEDMIAHFTTKCYRDLFSEVTMDGETVRLQDLRVLIEGMGVNKSDEELRKLFLLYDEDESGTIDFSEFAGITREISKDMPISTLVRSFQEARQRAKNKMAALKGWFTDEAPQEAAPKRKPCIKKARSMEDTLADSCDNCLILEVRIEDLQAELAAGRTEEITRKTELDEARKQLDEQQSRAHRHQQQHETDTVGDLAQKLAEQKESAANREAELLGRIEEFKAQLADAAAPPANGKKSEVNDLRNKCAKLERQIESLTSSSGELRQANAENEKLREQVLSLKGVSGPEQLQRQVWTSEAALEIRTRELYALRNRFLSSAVQIEAGNPRLAQELREAVKELAAKADVECGEQLGDTFEGFMRKKKSMKKKEAAAAAAAVRTEQEVKKDDEKSQKELEEKVKQVEVLVQENRRLQKVVAETRAQQLKKQRQQKQEQLVELQRQQSELQRQLEQQQQLMQRQQPAPAPTQIVVADPSKEMANELRSKTKEIEQLKAKLRKCQQALIIGTGESYDTRRDLDRARFSLKTVFDNFPEARTASYSPSGSPQSGTSPFNNSTNGHNFNSTTNSNPASPNNQRTIANATTMSNAKRPSRPHGASVPVVASARSVQSQQSVVSSASPPQPTPSPTVQQPKRVAPPLKSKPQTIAPPVIPPVSTLPYRTGCYAEW
ncbi:Calmodulin-like protein [Diplonema papillatum]|nr:Calmodulin-like protein [Diplonema papillatum]